MEQERKEFERVKLTNTKVERLESRGKYYDVHDSEMRGLCVRVHPTGAKVFYLRYTLPDGKRRSFRIGDADTVPVGEARDAARGHWASAIKGHDPMEEKQRPKDHTLKSFLAVYRKQATGKTAEETIARVERCFKPLLNTPLSDIRPMWIKNWRKARMDEGKSVGTINRDVTCLRTVLSFAVQDKLLAEHPLSGIKPLRTDSASKPRYLNPDEAKRLYAALDAREEEIRAARDSHNKWCRERELSEWPDLRAVAFADYLKPMTLLALNTGMRRGEIFNLAWEDCTLEGENPYLTIHGYGAKSGKTRHVPLNKTALDALAGWKAQTTDTGLVFVSPKSGGRFDNIRKSWAALTKKAKVNNFRFHDCRHHFASMLVQRGIDLNVVRELLGHQSMTMTLRYAYLAPDNTARAVAVLDAPDNVVPFPQEGAAD